MRSSFKLVMSSSNENDTLIGCCIILRQTSLTSVKRVSVSWRSLNSTDSVKSAPRLLRFVTNISRPSAVVSFLSDKDKYLEKGKKINIIFARVRYKRYGIYLVDTDSFKKQKDSLNKRTKKNMFCTQIRLGCWLCNDFVICNATERERLVLPKSTWALKK